MTFTGTRYPNLIKMHREMVLTMARSPKPPSKGPVDLVKQTITVASLNNLVFADQCDFEDFDMGNVGFGENRWKIFTRQYVNSEEYYSFIRQSKQVTKNGSELVFLAKPIGRKEKVTYNGTSSKLYGGGDSHRWGNCLLGMTFRFKPYPLLAMHSRTSALTKGGTLDLAFASITARNLAKELGIEQRDIGFAWMASSFQVSSWQLVPLATAWGLVERICKLDTPTGNSFRKYAIGRGRDYKYASSQRAIRKADEIARGEMPVTLVRDLEVPLESYVPKLRRSRTRDTEGAGGEVDTGPARNDAGQNRRGQHRLPDEGSPEFPVHSYTAVVGGPEPGAAVVRHRVSATNRSEPRQPRRRVVNSHPSLVGVP